MIQMVSFGLLQIKVFVLLIMKLKNLNHIVKKHMREIP